MKIFLIGKYPEKKDTEEYTKAWLKTLKEKQADFFYRKIFFKEEPIKSILKIPYFCLLLFLKKPKILHVQYFADVVGPFFPLLLIAAKLKPNLKTILLIHEKPDFVLNKLPFMLKNGYLLYEKITLSLADHLEAHTEEAKQSLIKYYKIKQNKITVIPHPWYEPIKISESKLELKNKYKIKNKFIFTIFGRVVPKKNIETVLPLVKKLTKNNYDVGLIIAGPVPKKYNNYFTKIKTQINDLNINNNIYIFGFLETEQVPEIMKITDINLFPYRSVTQSGVFFTALSYLTPVITYDLPGFSQLMNKNKIGLLVENQNKEKFYNAMQFIMNDQEELNKFKKNISAIKQEYSWQNTIEKYDELYKKI